MQILGSNSARVFRGVAILAALLSSGTAAALPIAEMQAGQALRDRIVNFGQFKVGLPEGDWTVVDVQKRDFNLSTGAAWLQYQHRSVYLASVKGSNVIALVALGSLETPQQGGGGGDPCATYAENRERYAFFDPMDSRIFMPECVVVTKKYPAVRIGRNSAGWRSVIESLKSSGLNLPQHIRRGFYAKSVVGNYLQMNILVRGRTDPSAFQQWMQNLAKSTSVAMKGDGIVGMEPFPPVQQREVAEGQSVEE